MVDDILRNLISISETFSDMRFKITVFAWGRRFEGRLITASDFGQALIRALDVAVTLSPDAYLGTTAKVQAAREARLGAVRVSVEGTHAGDIFISDVHVDGVALEDPMRIPEAAIQGYVFHGPAPTAETSYKAAAATDAVLNR